MRLDYQAELLLSFQEERRRKYYEAKAEQSRPKQPRRLGQRLLLGSGAMLIVIGSRLQRWSGSQSGTLSAEPASEVAWQ